MRKKTVFQFLLLTVSLIIVSIACSDEHVVNPIHPANGGEGYLTFTLPGVKTQPRSYGPVAGSALENQVDSLDIYMFTDSTNLLVKVFRPRNSALVMTGNNLTATIDVTGRKGDHTFYFVANSEKNALKLEDVNVGKTTEADFRERLTDINTGLLSAPFLMTAQYKVADIESAGTSAGTSGNEVKLTRRVARFDVDNDSSVTHFGIEKILLQNVYRQGYAFGEATGTPTQTLERGNLDPVNYKDSANANKAGLMESVFYLYPTKIGTGETTLSFEGEFMGQKRIYTLKTPANKPMEIGANKRYVLRVQKVDETKPELEGIIVDWEDVVELYQAEQQTNEASFSGITMTPNTGVTETKAPTTIGSVTEAEYDITDIKAQTTLSFMVESFNAEGCKHSISGNEEDLSGFTVEPGDIKLTYGARYVQPYTITIPERTVIKGKKPTIDVKVEIVNQAAPEQRLSISIKGDEILMPYPGTTLMPVVVGGVTWAPVNVGATEIGTSTEVKHQGNLFQWGRNVPFVYGGEPGDVHGTAGPLDITTATTGAAKDKFIKGSSTGDYDWLTPPQDDLWSGAKAQGPCPEGWRVPKKSELEEIFKLFTTDYASSSRLSFADGRLAVTGDNEGEVLYLPAAGYRHDSTGASSAQSANGYYWSSSPVDTRSSSLSFNVSNVGIGRYSRTYDFSVRCVQE